ncbi:MAG: hypothetical protein ACE5EX_05040, partial [Phycisphaerae bacterium]
MVDPHRTVLRRPSRPRRGLSALLLAAGFVSGRIGWGAPAAQSPPETPRVRGVRVLIASGATRIRLAGEG